MTVSEPLADAGTVPYFSPHRPPKKHRGGALSWNKTDLLRTSSNYCVDRAKEATDKSAKAAYMHMAEYFASKLAVYEAAIARRAARKAEKKQ